VEGLLHHGPRGRMRLSIEIGWADGNDRGSAGIGHWRQTGAAVPVAAARRSRRMLAPRVRPGSSPGAPRSPRSGARARAREELEVAKFVTIGYGDQAGYDRTDPAIRDAAHAHDAHLRQQGVEMGVAGQPVQVRNHDAAGSVTQDGPFMSSTLPVAGFAVIDAASLAEAVEIASRTPCAVAHGVVEVWPLRETP